MANPDPEQLAEEHTKDELLELADKANVDVAKSWNKTEIAEAIVHSEESSGRLEVSSDDISGKVTVDAGDVDPSVVSPEVASEKMNPDEPDWADAPRSEEFEQVKSVDRVAREVINGEWGEGDERQTRLEALGYDWDEVKESATRQLDL